MHPVGCFSSINGSFIRRLKCISVVCGLVFNPDNYKDSAHIDNHQSPLPTLLIEGTKFLSSSNKACVASDAVSFFSVKLCTVR